jgi:hypothetical protein
MRPALGAGSVRLWAGSREHPTAAPSRHLGSRSGWAFRQTLEVIDVFRY